MAYRLARQTLICLAIFGALVVTARAGDISIHAGYVNPGDLTVENVSHGLDGSRQWMRLGGMRSIGRPEVATSSPQDPALLI